jgi:hypothetical protein
MSAPRTLTFPQWMTRVDDACCRLCGCGRDDLPDTAYADMWEDGYTAREAARAAVRAAGDEAD